MEMPIEEKILACRDFRRRGNLFHKEGQYRRGALQYRQVILSLEYDINTIAGKYVFLRFMFECF